MVNRSFPEFAQKKNELRKGTQHLTLGERVHTVPRSVPTDQLLFKVFMGQRDKGRSAKALLDLFERPLVGSRPAWGSSPDCLTEYRRDPTDPHLLLQPSFFILYLLSA